MINIEFTEYELNELFYEDDSEYKTRFHYVSNRIGGESTEEEEENSDMDTDTDSSMPELVGPSTPEEGYRDEDIFDESMIRSITPPPIQIHHYLHKLHLIFRYREPSGVPSGSWEVTHLNISPRSIRGRIMTAVMGLTDEEINTFTLQE